MRTRIYNQRNADKLQKRMELKGNKYFLLHAHLKSYLLENSISVKVCVGIR